MVKQGLYEVALKFGSKKDAFEKLCFQLDCNGPKYQFNLGKNGFITDCLEKDDFTLKMISPREMNIEERIAINNLLAKLYYLNKDITYSNISSLTLH